MEEGHRAQGASLTMLNYTEKGTRVLSTSKECNGSFGAGQSKAWSGLVKHWLFF